MGNGVRRQGNGERAGRGKGGGSGSSFKLPPALFYSIPFLPISFRTGAACAAPVSSHFVSNGGSICCLRFFPFHFFSFCFERGQCMLPPFLPISFRTGAACIPHTAPFLNTPIPNDAVGNPPAASFRSRTVLKPPKNPNDMAGNPPTMWFLYPPIMGGFFLAFIILY